MAFFDELKARALDLGQVGAAKAKELTDTAKLNIANTSEEDTIRKAYIDLGKLYYAERGMAPEGAYTTLCEKITASKQKIEENKLKIAEVKAAGNINDDVASTVCDAPETKVPQEETPVAEAVLEKMEDVAEMVEDAVEPVIEKVEDAIESLKED